jgi:hypothetical protein
MATIARVAGLSRERIMARQAVAPDHTGTTPRAHKEGRAALVIRGSTPRGVFPRVEPLGLTRGYSLTPPRQRP